MTTRIPLAMAAPLLALALGCSDGGGGGGAGACTPTVQTDPDPAGAQQFCADLYGALCDRSFGDCPDIGWGELFASAEECRSEVLSVFCAGDYSNDWYDAACGGACLAFVRGVACAPLLASDEPQACQVATGSFGPDPIPTTAPGSIAPEPISTITPGTYGDTISSGDPVYDGGHARAYAISFTAGQAPVIETAAPSAGVEIHDTVVHLLDPGGAEIGYDDDGSADPLYSRLAVTIATTGYHRIIVRGWALSDVGSYQLSVTIPP